jgi:rhomboid protease GluP
MLGLHAQAWGRALRQETAMSDADSHPQEFVLRRIAQAAPGPWHPYREEGFDRHRLDDVLEALWLQDLIEKASPAAPDAGPAVALTPLGQRVLDDPDLLERLRQGEAIDPTKAAHVTRANLIHPPRVWVCKLILAANILVFLWGLYLAWRQGIAQSFLVGFTMGPGGLAILHTTGGMSGEDLVRGEWWRLITAGFNHIGLIHLGMNMYGLYSVGYFIEQRWGWWRFLIIYFLSVWTCSCLAMSYQPLVFTVGASGGLFGVFAALIGWLLLYGKYLPVWLRRQAWRSVMTNILILAILSYMLRGMVSHWGHAGGAIGGLAACFVLHFQRFGPLPLRAAAVALLLLLPYLGFAHLRQAQATQRPWQRLETASFLDREAGPISRVTDQTMETCAKHINPLMNQHVSRRDPKKVEVALAALEEQKEAIDAARERLRGRRFTEASLEAAREKSDELLGDCAELCDTATAYLRKGKSTRGDEELLVKQFGKVDDLADGWRKVIDNLREQVRAR